MAARFLGRFASSYLAFGVGVSIADDAFMRREYKRKYDRAFGERFRSKFPRTAEQFGREHGYIRSPMDVAHNVLVWPNLFFRKVPNPCVGVTSSQMSRQLNIWFDKERRDQFKSYPVTYYL